ncbi:hypothetical protein EVAR_258_1 [Eumeta japonica]|uniref:DDE Tnp4 domain-containing protein n=1 Tax=Eumeta variegata TaxID=151549 RepID=A0A4C1SCI1_EUMVA|nr:hypothetical protein EVAR_258_1 [Eumeta japonica]
MGKTIASIVHETCRVLWTELVPIHMPIPTEQRLKAIAEDFEATWNFPHCIGAIDGKHCEIKKKHLNLVRRVDATKKEIALSCKLWLTQKGNL